MVQPEVRPENEGGPSEPSVEDPPSQSNQVNDCPNPEVPAQVSEPRMEVDAAVSANDGLPVCRSQASIELTFKLEMYFPTIATKLLLDYRQLAQPSTSNEHSTKEPADRLGKLLFKLREKDVNAVLKALAKGFNLDVEVPEGSDALENLLLEAWYSRMNAGLDLVTDRPSDDDDGSLSLSQTDTQTDDSQGENQSSDCDVFYYWDPEKNENVKYLMPRESPKPKEQDPQSSAGVRGLGKPKVKSANVLKTPPRKSGILKRPKKKILKKTPVASQNSSESQNSSKMCVEQLENDEGIDPVNSNEIPSAIPMSSNQCQPLDLTTRNEIDIESSHPQLQTPFNFNFDDDESKGQNQDTKYNTFYYWDPDKNENVEYIIARESSKPKQQDSLSCAPIQGLSITKVVSEEVLNDPPRKISILKRRTKKIPVESQDSSEMCVEQLENDEGIDPLNTNEIPSVTPMSTNQCQPLNSSIVNEINIEPLNPQLPSIFNFDDDDMKADPTDLQGDDELRF